MRPFVLLTLMLASLATVCEAAAYKPYVKRVRAADPRAEATLREGRMRSASFRRVLARIDELDVIVYVQMQPLLRGRLSGRVTWVTATPEFRYVRIALNPELSGSWLVAALGHELQHVAEIGEAPSVVDTKTLAAYYRENGLSKHSESDQWDSEAAQRTGEMVRQELAMPSATRKAVNH